MNYHRCQPTPTISDWFGANDRIRDQGPHLRNTVIGSHSATRYPKP